MTVLNVAYPLAPVGFDAVGGAEQVLTAIDAALVQAGHRSLVLACEGSTAMGELITTPRVTGTWHGHMHEQAQSRVRCAIERLMGERRVDVVHLHGLDFHTYLPPPGVPVLVTLHLPPSWHEPQAFRIVRPRTFLHCVSRSQQAACPPCAGLLPPIENGVPADEWDPTVPSAGRPGDRDYVMTLGRICPEKGVHVAMAAAERAGIVGVIAGRVYPFASHEVYFAREIQPRLGPRMQFVGPVGPARKRELLRAARALIVASSVPETSSLVAMEALACGTPVIAFPIGALPEIVEHGQTGFLVHTLDDMVGAIAAAGDIDRKVCRAEAARRFSLARMTRRYIERYENLVRNASVQTPGNHKDNVAA